MGDDFTVNVKLPDGMLDQMKKRAKGLQFHDVQFYIRWLIARDVAPESDAANPVLALIHESDMSGPGRVADEAFYEEMNARLDRMIAEKAAAKVGRVAG